MMVSPAVLCKVLLRNILQDVSLQFNHVVSTSLVSCLVITDKSGVLSVTSLLLSKKKQSLCCLLNQFRCSDNHLSRTAALFIPVFLVNLSCDLFGFFAHNAAETVHASVIIMFFAVICWWTSWTSGQFRALWRSVTLSRGLGVQTSYMVSVTVSGLCVTAVHPEALNKGCVVYSIPARDGSWLVQNMTTLPLHITSITLQRGVIEAGGGQGGASCGLLQLMTLSTDGRPSILSVCERETAPATFQECALRWQMDPKMEACMHGGSIIACSVGDQLQYVMWLSPAVGWLPNKSDSISASSGT